MKRKSGAMPARAISIITAFLILTSCMFFTVPVFASNAASDISGKKLGLNEIIEYTYNENFNQLTPHEQWLMKTAFFQVEAKLFRDPEGYLSMAYMAMVTAGANQKAQAVMAAWGAQKYPESPCLLNNLGYALSILKEYDNAETVYKRVLELDEKRLETIINLGNLYLDIDRDKVKDATENIKAGIKAPQKPWPYEYNNLKDYFITRQAYGSASPFFMSDESNKIVMPQPPQISEQADNGNRVSA